MTPLLELTEVHSYYGDNHVIRGISMAFDEGVSVALLGRNGMGKTTLLRSIIGFTPARQGRIHFQGTDITHLPPNQIARLGVALVPQGRRIFPSLSVKENLTIGARKSRDNRGWDIEKVFRLFPILKERAKMKGTLLSGGEQQMLAIARVLLANPKLILMDEPSEGLAPAIVKELGRVIGTLKDDGISIVLVEQNVPLALGLTDYAYILSKGTIVCESESPALRQNKELQDRYICITRD
jgi:branched-chain amino acid transport system ATP-binding protein